MVKELSYGRYGLLGSGQAGPVCLALIWGWPSAVNSILAEILGVPNTYPEKCIVDPRPCYLHGAFSIALFAIVMSGDQSGQGNPRPSNFHDLLSYLSGLEGPK